MKTYQRETDEFLPVRVTRAGTPVTSGLEFCIVPTNQRPSGWVPQITREVDGTTKVGVQVVDLTQGTWAVYARVAAEPDTPVVKAGEFYVA